MPPHLSRNHPRPERECFTLGTLSSPSLSFLFATSSPRPLSLPPDISGSSLAHACSPASSGPHSVPQTNIPPLSISLFCSCTKQHGYTRPPHQTRTVQAASKSPRLHWAASLELWLFMLPLEHSEM
ncbi:hypothetical protein K438DRAFT_1860680 [Mycena galopus ATCC 62051]|nr:hypothetical protein K438DRAFT_1860680 [Mycena galopus ATCC 62051]